MLTTTELAAKCRAHLENVLVMADAAADDEQRLMPQMARSLLAVLGLVECEACEHGVVEAIAAALKLEGK